MARWCIAVDNARRPTSDADESSPVSKRKRKLAPSNITFTLPDGKKVKLGERRESPITPELAEAIGLEEYCRRKRDD